MLLRFARGVFSMLPLSHLSASSSSSSNNPPNSNSSTSRTRRCSMDVIRPRPLGRDWVYFGIPDCALRPVTVYNHIRYNVTVIRQGRLRECTKVDEECETVEYQSIGNVINVSRDKKLDLFFVRTHEQ